MSAQKYNIFFNDHVITVGMNPVKDGWNRKSGKYASDEITKCLNTMFSSGKKACHFYIQSKEPGTTLKEIIKHFRLVKAAGGVVFNLKNEILMIKRLGKWDLPKGKLEKGELLRIAALREVHEECGIAFLALVKKYADTYHIYKEKKEFVLKHTVWFQMISWKSDKPIPQTNENITEARWVKRGELPGILNNTYNSLVPLIQSVINQKT